MTDQKWREIEGLSRRIQHLQEKRTLINVEILKALAEIRRLERGPDLRELPEMTGFLPEPPDTTGDDFLLEIKDEQAFEVYE